MKKSFIIIAASSVFLYLFLYLPIAAVAVGSFNNTVHGAGWHGFTWKWYAAIVRNEAAASALKNTLYLALASAAISTVLGSMLGYGLSKHQFRGKTTLSRLLYLPFCLPDIILGVALMLFFSIVRPFISFLEPGFIPMLLAHITFQIPFVAMVVRARATGLDPTLEAAAHDLGATPIQRFRYVTLPLISPGIVAGALLAFTLSLDDFVVSFFTSGAGSTTLPILIYSSVKRGITPEINVLSTLLVVAAVFSTITLSLLQRKLAVEKSDHPR